MTCSKVVHVGVEFSWSWESSLLGPVVGVYSEGQLPRPDNDCKLGGVYCTVGYCLGMKEK